MQCWARSESGADRLATVRESRLQVNPTKLIDLKALIIDWPARRHEKRRRVGRSRCSDLKNPQYIIVSYVVLSVESER